MADNTITYKRTNLVGEKEELTGEPTQLIFMLKLLEANEDKAIGLGVEDREVYLDLDEDKVKGNG